MADQGVNYRRMLRGIWRPEFADHRPPIKAKGEGVVARGSYQILPWLAFTRETKEGPLHLLSDGALNLQLAPVAGDPLAFTLAGAPGTIRFTDKAGKGGFEVTGTAVGAGLAVGRYVRMQVKKQDPGLQQTLGSIFVHTVAQFGAVRRGYNVTQMELDNPQQAGDAVNVFKLPSRSSKAYEQVGDMVVPFGWTYAPDEMKYGGGETRIVSSGRDLQTRATETLGQHAGLDIFGLKLGADQTQGQTTQVDEMYNNELTLSTHSNVLTKFAYVLDKSNAPLTEDFYKAVVELMQDQNFPRFFSVVGTHYTHATTYGGKGYVVNTYTKDQVMAMHDQGVDLKTAVNFGFSEQYGGVGAGASGGIDVGSGQAQHEKFERIVGKEASQYRCIGDCTNGDPAGASLVPVYLDLRPISDLLAPPYFTEWQICVQLRQAVARHLQDYAFYAIDARTGQSSARFYSYRYDSNHVYFANGDGSPAEWAAAMPGPHSVVNVPGGLIEVELLRGSDLNAQPTPEVPSKFLREPGDKVLLMSGSYVYRSQTRQFMLYDVLQVPMVPMSLPRSATIGKSQPVVMHVGGGGAMSLESAEGDAGSMYIDDAVRRFYNIPPQAMMAMTAKFTLETITSLDLLTAQAQNH